MWGTVEMAPKKFPLVCPSRAISSCVPGSIEKVPYTHQFQLGAVSIENNTSAGSIRKVPYTRFPIHGGGSRAGLLLNWIKLH